MKPLSSVIAVMVAASSLCSCSRQGMGDFEVVDFGGTQKGLGEKSTGSIVVPPSITKMESIGDYVVGLCQPITTGDQKAIGRWMEAKGYFILNTRTKQLLIGLSEEEFRERARTYQITNSIVSLN